MLIDCDTCRAPASACGGCVMTVLLRGQAGLRAGPAGGGPGRGAPARPGVELDDAERDAIAALARAGLVPPLRLVRAVTPAEAGWPAEPAGSRAGSRGVDAAQGIA